MAVVSSEYELQALPELEGEYESNFEGEGESEQFFGALRQLAGRAGQWAVNQATTQGSPLRRVAFRAAHSVLQNAPRIFGGIGKAIGTGNRRSAGLGGALGNAVGYALKGLDPLVPQCEGEFECEMEGEISPVRKWYPDAMLEHLGHAAAQAEGEAEAEALIGAMIPWAARAVPGARAAISRSAPGLVCGATGAMHKLRQSPSTQPLVRLIPSIVKRTATNIAHQAARDGQVDPRQAVRTLARQTYQMLSSPQLAAQAFRRSQQMDRRFHHHGTGLLTRPRCQNCGSYRAR